MKRIPHWIGGRPHDDGGRAGDVYNPARGEASAQVSFASGETVDKAVQIAHEAYLQWRDIPAPRRARVMFAFRELIETHKDELVDAIVSEHGKVPSDAMGEIQRGLEVVEFACGIPHLLKGDFSFDVASNVDTYSARQPLGVVAGITPFNFPVMVPMWMYPVAIACGNAFVLKPSEKDPSASIVMARLFGEAGLPDGVFNVVHGDKVAVDALLMHPLVAAVSSVGSTPVARYIYETAAAHGKRVQALGGAKNHMIVLPDADVSMAADAAVSAAFGSTGQRCMAVSAVVAVGAAGDVLRDEIAARIAKLRVGPGTDPDAEMGPLVTAAAKDKVLGYIETGLNEGAELAVDGRADSSDADGFFVGPCLFDHVKPDMTIYTDEIFGPVLVMVRSNSFEDAVELVNSNPYGNGVAIFTSEGGAARRFAHDVEVGMVGINVPIPVPMAFYSFGGWKHSLFGDSHVHGAEGVHFYTRGKVITSRWPEPSSSRVNLGFPT